MPVETILIALTTFFATIGPADLALVFAAIQSAHTGQAVKPGTVREVPGI